MSLVYHEGNTESVQNFGIFNPASIALALRRYVYKQKINIRTTVLDCMLVPEFPHMESGEKDTDYISKEVVYDLL